MEEGQIKFERLGADLYGVRSDVNSDVAGNLEYVGSVRSERDWSAASKRRARVSFIWFARHAGSKAEVGPFATRKAAAARLV